MDARRAALRRGPEVFLNQAPFSFDLSVMDLYPAWSTGGTLVSVTADEVANPKRLYRLLAASGVTAWVSTPSFARLCLAERSFDQAMLPPLRRFLFCGETLAAGRRLPAPGPLPGRGGLEHLRPHGGDRRHDLRARLTARSSLANAPLPIGYPMPGSRVVGDGGDRGALPAVSGARSSSPARTSAPGTSTDPS